MVYPFPINKKDTMLNMKSVKDSLSHYCPFDSFLLLYHETTLLLISITFHISRSRILCPYTIQPQQFKTSVSYTTYDKLEKVQNTNIWPSNNINTNFYVVQIRSQ